MPERETYEPEKTQKQRPKGKGKGRGAPPPPLPTAAPAKPMTSTKCQYINVFWKSLIIEAKDAEAPPKPMEKNIFLEKLIKSPLFSKENYERPVRNLPKNTIFSMHHDLPCPDSLKYYFGRKKNQNVEKLVIPESRPSLMNRREKSIQVFLGSISKKSLKGIRDLRKAILTCDHSILDANVISNLRTVQPTPAESKKYDAFVMQKIDEKTSNNKRVSVLEIISQMDCSEQFIFLMTRIPDLKERLEAMHIEVCFDETYHELYTKFTTIHECVQTIQRYSSVLQKLFSYVISVGNRMNDGSSIPQAETLHISAFHKLLETRSSHDSEISLFHYVVSLLESHEVEDFVAGTRSKLMAASKLNLYGLYTEVVELADVICKIESVIIPKRLIDTFPHFDVDHDVEDRLKTCLQDFINEAEIQMSKLLLQAVTSSDSYDAFTGFLGNFTSVSQLSSDDSEENSFQQLYKILGFLEKSQFDSQIPKMRRRIRNQEEDTEAPTRRGKASIRMDRSVPPKSRERIIPELSSVPTCDEEKTFTSSQARSCSIANDQLKISGDRKFMTCMDFNESASFKNNLEKSSEDVPPPPPRRDSFREKIDRMETENLSQTLPNGYLGRLQLDEKVPSKPNAEGKPPIVPTRTWKEKPTSFTQYQENPKNRFAYSGREEERRQQQYEVSPRISQIVLSNLVGSQNNPPPKPPAFNNYLKNIPAVTKRKNNVVAATQNKSPPPPKSPSLPWTPKQFWNRPMKNNVLPSFGSGPQKLSPSHLGTPRGRLTPRAKDERREDLGFRNTLEDGSRDEGGFENRIFREAEKKIEIRMNEIPQTRSTMKQVRVGSQPEFRDPVSPPSEFRRPVRSPTNFPQFKGRNSFPEGPPPEEPLEFKEDSPFMRNSEKKTKKLPKLEFRQDEKRRPRYETVDEKEEKTFQFDPKGRGWKKMMRLNPTLNFSPSPVGARVS